ncbi:MAG: histidine kinase [Leifsonia sp.]
MNTSTPPNWLAFGLNLVGGAIVGYSLVTEHTKVPTWVLVLALAAVSAWVLRALVALLPGVRRLAIPLSVFAALTGGLVAAPTQGLAVVPAALGVLFVLAQVELPPFVGFGLSLVTVALVAIGAVPFGSPVLAVLAMMGGVVLATFAGLSRRQYRLAEEQTALLREQALEVREERAHAELLGQRQEVARDIHDVLAHSLGGLVIQLDAVDALLDVGDVAAAQQRVMDARRLAADGLGEARRAVAALRDPATASSPGATATAGEPVAPEGFTAAMEDLLAAHRSLGGVVDLAVTGHPVSVDRAVASAVQRALQEALSNVRKHAPGEPVRARLDWQTSLDGENGRMRLTVSNPLAEGAHLTLASSGGGHGLDGMRERFAALPLGGTATAEVVGDRFTVVVEAPLAKEAQ